MKVILLILSLLISPIALANPNDNIPYISNVNVRMLTSFLSENVSIHIADGKYKTVTPYEMSLIYNIHRAYLFEKDIIKWYPNFDCDDYSTSMRLHAALFFKQYYSFPEEYTPPEAIAVGEVFYLIDGHKNKGHAINFFIDPGYNIVFFEPQNGKIVELTQAEKESIFMIRI